MRIAGTSLRPLEVWRRDVSTEQAVDFARSLLASAVRLGSGSLVAERGSRPTEALILYERESCPYSRLVREALSELDLDALIKPVPSGETAHRAELEKLTSGAAVPFLIDRAAGVELGESQRIVEHLFKHYGDGRVPLRFRGPLAVASSKLACELRGNKVQFQRPTRLPELSLELWNYEGSPYCRLVREHLCTFGIAYVSRNLARSSPRRAEYLSRFGVMQFPRLYDPNTRIGMFESDAIISYITANYGRAFLAVDEMVSAHPA
jgi:glutathione S-transferase